MEYRTITPAAATFEHMQYPTDDAVVVNSLLASNIRRHMHSIRYGIHPQDEPLSYFQRIAAGQTATL